MKNLILIFAATTFCTLGPAQFASAQATGIGGTTNTHIAPLETTTTTNGTIVRRFEAFGFGKGPSPAASVAAAQKAINGNIAAEIVAYGVPRGYYLSSVTVNMTLIRTTGAPDSSGMWGTICSATVVCVYRPLPPGPGPIPTPTVAVIPLPPTP